MKNLFLASMMLVMSVCAHAQFNAFSISNCIVSIYDGVYNDSGKLKNNAACYINASEPRITMQFNGTGWGFGVYTDPGRVPCEDKYNNFSPYSNTTTTNFSLAVPLTTGICGAGIAVGINYVPTIGEWGIICLSLLMGIVGVVGIRTQVRA